MEAIIIAVIGSGVISTVITIVANAVSRHRDKETGAKAALRQLLYLRIKQNCKIFIEQGYIEAEELEDLIDTHKIYHDLGGNGFLDARMAKVKALPNKD